MIVGDDDRWVLGDLIMIAGSVGADGAGAMGYGWAAMVRGAMGGCGCMMMVGAPGDDVWDDGSMGDGLWRARGMAIGGAAGMGGSR